MARLVRAVVDANVWLAAVISLLGVNSKVLDALMGREFVHVASEEVLNELFGVLINSGDAHARGFGPDDARATVSYLREVSYRARITGTLTVCGHPADDRLIETAVVGRADVIVSQDGHVTHPAVKRHLSGLGIQVLSPREFLDLIHHR